MAYWKNGKQPKRRSDHSGERYGRLTLMAFSHYRDGTTDQHYLARCDCGTQLTVGLSAIRQALKDSGNVSCGCYHAEVSRETNKQFRTDPATLMAKRVFYASYSDGDLTLEQFIALSQEPCHYCGRERTNTRQYSDKVQVSEEWRNASSWSYNGLDRLDSTYPHNVNNVVSCCWMCNRAKGDTTVEQFREWLVRAYKVFGKP